MEAAEVRLPNGRGFANRKVIRAGGGLVLRLRARQSPDLGVSAMAFSRLAQQPN